MKITTGWWCRILSTEGHQHCTWRSCDCTCHLHGGYGEAKPRRPHSFSRVAWSRGKRPPGWKRTEAERRRVDRLAGFAQPNAVFDDEELRSDD